MKGLSPLSLICCSFLWTTSHSDVLDGNTVLAQPLDERVDVTVLTGVLDASCHMVDEGDPPQEEEADPCLLAV